MKSLSPLVEPPVPSSAGGLPVGGDSPVRYAELDALRGAAILAMIAYHAYVISSWVGVIHPSLSPVVLEWLQKPIPITFIFTSGLSYSILSRRAAASPRRYRMLARPVLRVAGAAALVSLATYIMMGEGFVRFGILHLIATSWLLAMVMPGRRGTMALIAVAILITKALLGTPQVWSSWWVWAGFPYPGFYTLDYFPLIPWFAVFLWGIIAGSVIYRHSGRPSWLRSVSEYSECGGGRVLASAGRRALAIYLVHVPIIYFAARGWAALSR